LTKSKYVTIAKAAFWLILTLLAVWASWQIWQQLRFYIHNFKKKNQTTDGSAKKTIKDLSVAEWLLRAKLAAVFTWLCCSG
jgi:hypothetical protein